MYTTADALYAFPATCSTPCSPLWIGPGVGALPAVSDGTVFVDAGFVNRFQAFPTSCSSPCSPLWTAFTESNAVTAPAIAGGNVYLVEFNGALQAFPAKCSTPCMPIWTMRGFSPYSSPAVANGVIYVGGADNKIYALDAATGAILFSGPIGGTSYVLSPAVADGVVYATASFLSPGTLAAFALPQ